MLGVATACSARAPLAAAFSEAVTVFPTAPSRFSVALRSGTVRQPAIATRRSNAMVSRHTGRSSPHGGRADRALNAHDHVTRGHCERVRPTPP
jgi:hypothetical protein